MNNSFFVYTNTVTPLSFERFHICTWEFGNNSSLIEFGGEIKQEFIGNEPNLVIRIVIPWLTKKCIVEDLYDRLKEASNSKFIFNDSVKATSYLDSGLQKKGVIHDFKNKGLLCIMPVTLTIIEDQIMTINIDLRLYNNFISNGGTPSSIYFRFKVIPEQKCLSIRKPGFGKATIIYDIKINEERNIPENNEEQINDGKLCKIENCFCFNIIPNSFDCVFADESIKNTRTLETNLFKSYLLDSRIKPDELLVVFNKQSAKKSYSFFSIYSKEWIGSSQYALAILINILSGLLLFLPSYRETLSQPITFTTFFSHLPFEIWVAILLDIFLIIYFFKIRTKRSL